MHKYHFYGLKLCIIVISTFQSIINGYGTPCIISVLSSDFLKQMNEYLKGSLYQNMIFPHDFFLGTHKYFLKFEFSSIVSRRKRKET